MYNQSQSKRRMIFMSVPVPDHLSCFSSPLTNWVLTDYPWVIFSGLHKLLLFEHFKTQHQRKAVACLYELQPFMLFCSYAKKHKFLSSCCTVVFMKIVRQIPILVIMRVVSVGFLCPEVVCFWGWSRISIEGCLPLFHSATIYILVKLDGWRGRVPTPY